MTRLATAWLVYRLTNSAFLLGLVSFASQVPAMVIPAVAGVWLDRWDRHKVLIATQVLAMIQSLALAALTLSGHVTVTWVVWLSLFQGFITAIEIPTRQSFVITMIDDRRDLPTAIALNSSSFNAARLVGPAMGGGLVAAVGEGYCFLIDGLSYLAVIAGLVAMRISKSEAPRERREVWHELSEGWAYLIGSGPIRQILIFLGIVGIASAPYAVLTPMVAAQLLGGGPNTLGLLMAASGIGALAGAVRLVLRRSGAAIARPMTLGVVTFGVGCVALGLSRWLWLSVPLMAITAYGLMTQIVSTNTIVQTVVDDDKRGRVMSFYTIALLGSAPIGSLLSGSLAARIGVTATLIVSGIACALTASWFWRQIPEIGRAMHDRHTELGIPHEA